MRKSFFILLCLFQSSLGIAQDTARIAPEDLLADLDILATTIEENHPMMDAYITQDSFGRMSEDLIQKIGSGMSLRDFHAEVSHMLQSLGCGHTYAFATNEMAQRLNWLNDLPFDVIVRDTAIFITDVFTVDIQHYAGAEVLSINGHPAKQLIVSAFKAISSDGYNTTYKAYKFRRNFNYFLNLILDNPDSLLLSTTAGNFTIHYPTSFLKEESKDPETHFSVLVDVPDAVLLTVPAFDDGKGAIRKCFKYMEEHHTAHLVVDLRDNGGGNGGIGAYLVSFIMDTSLTYYLEKKDNPLRYRDLMKRKEGLLIANQYIMTDSMTRSYYFKIKPKRKHNFDGKVYVLTNGGTFSTGSFTASALKHACDAICFGIETGGSAYAIGGGVIRTLVLPYTGLAIRFPIYRWRFNVAPEDQGRGVIPDVEVDDYRGGVLSEPDAGLQVVKANILSQVSNPR